MSTKLIMTASALSMAILGVAFSFLPVEILAYFGKTVDPEMGLMLQLAGALYIGFAMLNWMAKSILIGGIYARPVAIGNLTHFLVGGVALFKAQLHGNGSVEGWVLTGGYLLFAALFAWVMLTHPLKSPSQQ
ncbi:hypothetical protein TH61_08400 [Rufibacter sp. DG15C]|uniref:hypothetical protein n=1 Tax=Rufibacter sp. DG15C TaxID=1379909 RepID=UPI00078DF30A|nr:hypothetical protein [Rufibacter sp. DG15C]AMM51194.1 hypothetical protein TH61_08400 [Rufibacter sp. DG15C]